MDDETCFFIPIPGSYRVRTGRCDGGTPPTVTPPMFLHHSSLTEVSVLRFAWMRGMYIHRPSVMTMSDAAATASSLPTWTLGSNNAVALNSMCMLMQARRLCVLSYRYPRAIPGGIVRTICTRFPCSIANSSAVIMIVDVTDSFRLRTG